MNKKTFLKELRRELDSLPFEEREAAITYYEEYFDEAGPEREQEVIQNFGSPASIAAELKTTSAVNNPPKTPKEGVFKVWWVIIALFAAPIALPLVIALAAVIFSLFVAFFSLIFAFGVTAFALTIAGLVIFIAGFVVLIADPLSGVFFIGIGVVILGLGILFGFGTFFVATKLMGVFARLLGSILNKVKARNKTS